MYEWYEFYQVFQFQIPELLAISSFIRKNNDDTRNISRILKEATDVSQLQSYRTEIKNEIERLKQIKNHQNIQYYALKPLPNINLELSNLSFSKEHYFSSESLYI